MNTILEKLNPEQLKPVLQTEGPVLVLAGAGSGKTRVLTSRIAYLIDEKGVSPSSILAITFTNKAANEMKERVARLTTTDGMWVCTIHSMCVRILRRYAEEIGMTENFSIYSETERANVIKQAFSALGNDDEKILKNVKWHISNAKMLGLSPDEYAREYSFDRSIDDVIKVYGKYNEHLRKNNALDFDDLLVETRRLLLNNPDALEYLSGKFRYIMVDEFQDTNGVQFDIIKMLASVHKNLFAVGDDDQSIYGWRGAKIENILNFEKSFPGAYTFKLEQNYRSTKEILNLANAVIHHNGKRKDKTLWTENPKGDKVRYFEAESEGDEALYTVKCIAQAVNGGARLSDFAVLMRINALTRSYEQEFAKYNIPYKVFGGFKFFERKEIKDLLAYMRILNNPFDSEAIVRIINFPRRGIGDKTVETLQRYAEENDLSVYDALIDTDELNISGATKAKLKAFADLIKELVIMSQDADLTVIDIVNEIIERTKMEDVYSDDSEESMAKLANIKEFTASVEEFCRLNEGASLSDYLNQVTLSSDTDEMDESEYVTLATIHSVKGLEFKNVFICGLEENIMPTSRAYNDKDSMEEERRLMYVAVTRAKEKLWLTRSRSRYLYGKRELTAASMFLNEVSEHIDMPHDRLPHKRYDGDFYSGSYKSYDSYSDEDSYYSYGGRRNSSYSSYGDNSRRNSYYSNGADYGAKNTFGSGMNGVQSGRRPVSVKPVSAKPVSAVGSVKNNDVTVFTVGARVRHSKFGDGLITEVSGNPASPIITVKFDQAGVKKLSAALAPLTVLR